MGLPVMLQLFQQAFFPAARYIDARAIAHDKVTPFPADVFADLVEVDKIRMMYPEETMFFEHFFYFLECAGYDQLLRIL